METLSKDVAVINHKGEMFADKTNRNLSHLFEKFVFENYDGNWIGILPKKNNKKNSKHSSTELTPIHASIKKKEGFVYQNILDKRKKKRFNLGGKVRPADKKKKL